MRKSFKKHWKKASLTKVVKPPFPGSIETKQDVDDYIKYHEEWWSLGRLHFFTEDISDLVTDSELRSYFSRQIALLRENLESQRRNEIAKGEISKKIKSTMKDAKQPGDVYGEPQFYRFGECGHSKKKRKATDFMKKKY